MLDLEFYFNRYLSKKCDTDKKNFSFFDFKKFVLASIFVAILIVVTSYLSRISHIHQASSIEDSSWIMTFEEAIIKDKYRVIVLMPEESSMNQGAVMLARRIKIAASNIGWEAFLLKGLSDNISAIKIINPDFIISAGLNHDLSGEVLPYKIYAYFTQSTKTYFGGLISFAPVFKEGKYPYIDRISGFLCAFKALNLLKKYKEEKGGKFYGFRTFPTTQKTEFETLKYKSLVYFGSNWDRLRSSNRFKILFEKLSEEKILNVYGPEYLWSYINSSWRGLIDDDGWKVIDITKKYGISLIIHAKRYNTEGIPSARVFEAIASSSILISDKNKFIIDNFGDSVLYINAEKSANEMYQEITKHIKWIVSHPTEASKKAKRAHDILRQKFTLENELIKIAKMHETILLESDEKNR